MRSFFIEQWITAYLQIISGLLIFTVGVSALIIQIALPAYLRQLMKRRHISKFTVAILFLYIVATVILIWLGFSDPPLPQLFEMIVNLLMLFVLVATVAYALAQLRQIDSSRFIESLYRECRVDILKREKFDDTLETLIDVGRQSGAGYEKQRVLESLHQLVIFVLEHYEIKTPESEKNFFARVGAWWGRRWAVLRRQQTPYYNGSMFKELIYGLEVILAESQTEGSVENFRAAQKILETLIVYLTKDSRSEDSEDLYLAIQVCGRLTILTLERFEMGTQDAFIGTLEKSLPEERGSGHEGEAVLREVGVAALKGAHFRPCIHVLNAMVAWGDPAPIDANGSTELLGLMAHVWTCNSAGQEMIRMNLLRHHEYRFKDGLEKSLDAACSYHFRAGNYETYECLKRFKCEIGSNEQPTKVEPVSPENHVR